MLLIKEVEMVDSVDDLKTSQSIGGHRFQNFEMLDAKIASRILTSRRKSVLRSNRPKCKSDVFLRVRQIAYMIFE